MDHLDGEGPTVTGKDTHRPTLTAPGTMVGNSRLHVARAGQREGRTRVRTFSRSGSVLYEMATGQVAFDGDTAGVICGKILHVQPSPPSVMNPKTPYGFEQIILRALEKDRRSRYQHASEMLLDLRRLQQDTWLFPRCLALMQQKAISKGVNVMNAHGSGGSTNEGTPMEK